MCLAYIVLTYVDSNPTGNTPIQLCPKGVSDASDAGDNSKDRILATNGDAISGKTIITEWINLIK